MSQATEVSLDNQGCIRIPADVQKRLGLMPGMTLVVEEEKMGGVCLRIQSQSLFLVDKGGVLVFTGKATENIEDVTRHERDRRLSDLIERTGL